MGLGPPWDRRMKRTVSFYGLRGFRVFGVMLGPQYFEQGFGVIFCRNILEL